MGESIEYFQQWEKKAQTGDFKPLAWQRTERQLKNPDRRWMWKHVLEPVLDVGCGSATDSLVFKRYVGLDITPSFIRAAKTHGAENLILGDARNLPIRDKALETSYCKDLLLHLPFGDAVKVLTEILRVGRKTFVAWGFEYTVRGTHIYTPIMTGKENSVEKKLGFWYNRFLWKKLNQYCKIGNTFKGTSITEVREK